jgi:predicted DNA-binding transcriptional regulator AlpA
MHFFGGTKPLNRATAWRWVRKKKIPPPVPDLGRWLRDECVAAKKAMIAKRNVEAA